jgi:hypothetical protein
MRWLLQFCKQHHTAKQAFQHDLPSTQSCVIPMPKQTNNRTAEGTGCSDICNTVAITVVKYGNTEVASVKHYEHLMLHDEMKALFPVCFFF